MDASRLAKEEDLEIKVFLMDWSIINFNQLNSLEVLIY